MNCQADREINLCNGTVMLMTCREQQPEIILNLCATCKIFPIGLEQHSLTVSFNMLSNVHSKLKGKVMVLYVLKFYWKSRFIAPFTLQFNVSAVITQVYTSDALSPEKDPQVPIDQAAGRTPELFLTPRRTNKSLPLPEFDMRFLSCPLQPSQCADGTTSNSTRH